MSLAKNGNLEAQGKLVEAAHSAVQAEVSATGGTQTNIYQEVTNGLSSVANKIDRQNGINFDDAKNQLNELLAIKVSSNQLVQIIDSQINTTAESINDLRAYEKTSTAAYMSAVEALKGMVGTFTSALSAIPSISNAMADIPNKQSVPIPPPPPPQPPPPPPTSTVAPWYYVFWAALEDPKIHKIAQQWGETHPNASQREAFDYLDSKGLIPSFAVGGMFPGGMRIVGERGPELEITGPSRIFDASATHRMLSPSSGSNDNSALVAEIRGLKAELATITNAIMRSGGMVAGTVQVGTAETRRQTAAMEAASRRPVPISQAV